MINKSFIAHAASRTGIYIPLRIYCASIKKRALTDGCYNIIVPRSSDGPIRHPIAHPVGHPTAHSIRTSPPRARAGRRAVSIHNIPVAGNTDDRRARAPQCHYLLGGPRVCMGTFPFRTPPISTWILGRNGPRRRYTPPSPDNAVHGNRGGTVARALRPFR